MKHLCLSLCTFISMSISGQRIETVVAILNDESITVKYTLREQSSLPDFEVSLYCSKDNGYTWEGPLKHVSGDVGEGVQPGYGKKIQWNVLDEWDYLYGENIRFRVTANYNDGFNYVNDQTIVDHRDDNQYRVVKIGNQNWMAENLRYAWSLGDDCYEGKEKNCKSYGRLYGYFQATKACPRGWHLPSKEEYEDLITLAGGQKLAARQLKSVEGWNPISRKAREYADDNVFSTNETGFTALPGGHGTNSEYTRMGWEAAFWTSTEFDEKDVYYMYLWSTKNAARFAKIRKQSYKYAVRCVQNREQKYTVSAETKSGNFRIFKASVTDRSGPSITLTTPQMEPGSILQTDQLNILLEGKMEDPSGVYEARLNDSPIDVAQDGSFRIIMKLEAGDNHFSISSTDQKFNTNKATYALRRTEHVSSTGPLSTQSGTTTSGFGNYYALIIGIENYQDHSIDDLDQPIGDAIRLKEILSRRYTFHEENIMFLENPTRADIIDQMDQLVSTVNSNDNLLIFYAGHGHWDENRETGYWLPADSRKGSTANWLRNSTIQEYIEDLPTRHTLLIADACFSGGIFKTRRAFGAPSAAIEKLYQLPSRKAMTSGNLKEVPDKSVFLDQLINSLERNHSRYISALELFAGFREAVLNNSPNAPQYGVIMDTGDQGGEFIFKLR